MKENGADTICKLDKKMKKDIAVDEIQEAISWHPNKHQNEYI